MQNNNLIGRLVISKAGRDKDSLYLIVNIVDKNYVLVANGYNKTHNMPKKKKLKHLLLTDVISDDIKLSILSQNKNIDLKIKKFIKLNGTIKEV
ncbi:hypothetical protein [Clostridium tarantellae]|uniref:RNA-binding protein n=1 Tax=Clostridium tarantellae TaxID=39493 RepID=A0A6I1MK46_9CLOT|nr:hypothetical protein [Clostridium tarantellae]MPQ42808.1 hypothetical protein [Clostridium tarantellae]